MSQQYPDWIDPWKAAEGRRQFGGSIRLGGMSRLAPLLANAEGEAQFSARFRLDGERRPLVDLDVEATLPLRCQVTMQVFLHPARCHTRLRVLRSESEQDDLPGDAEATLATEGRLRFLELVEDELLLALPQVPRKPGADAQAAGGDAAQGPARTHRPFAGLQELMKADARRRKPGKH